MWGWLARPLVLNVSNLSVSRLNSHGLGSWKHCHPSCRSQKIACSVIKCRPCRWRSPSPTTALKIPAASGGGAVAAVSTRGHVCWHNQCCPPGRSGRHWWTCTRPPTAQSGRRAPTGSSVTPVRLRGMESPAPWPGWPRRDPTTILSRT